MRIGLYIEHGDGNGVGGAELMMAHLASAWSRAHEVHLIHHRPPLTKERIASFSTDDYSRVIVRCLPRDEEPQAFTNPFHRYGAARDWHRGLSEGYDLFVNCTHWLPAFCHARVGALLVLFPFYVRPGESPQMRALPRWKQLRHGAYHDIEWQRRLATYQHRFAISEFTRDWTERRWGINCRIVHPPVDVNFGHRSKEQLVLSVGRFSTKAHTKKQLEMMQSFCEMHRGFMAGWTYACVGGLNARVENHTYFERVRQAGAGASTLVEANLDRARVKNLFERARIFWHATGLGEDPDAHPELAEHFGIATVEAMAAGCVPVVINRGGQPEIVQHGVTGFVWNTLDELRTYTQLLAEDHALWTRMSAAARARAHEFSRERFVDQLSRACGVVQTPAPDVTSGTSAWAV
jgi:glycosyltransferase involved in cell wall biosynthesis